MSSALAKFKTGGGVAASKVSAMKEHALTSPAASYDDSMGKQFAKFNGNTGDLTFGKEHNAVDVTDEDMDFIVPARLPRPRTVPDSCGRQWAHVTLRNGRSPRDPSGPPGAAAISVCPSPKESRPPRSRHNRDRETEQTARRIPARL